MPVSGMIPTIPPTMMKDCSANANVRPTASSFENPSLASSAMEAARDEEHVDEQQPCGADEPELLRERGEDEVGVQVGDERVRRAGLREDAVSRPVPPKPPWAIE